MGVQPVRIETLGDLVAHDHGMNAMCGRCHHRCDLDMNALIAKLGSSFRYIGKALDRFLVCSACGIRQVETQIHCRSPAAARGSQGRAFAAAAVSAVRKRNGTAPASPH
jgi:hypothetical protein